MQKVVSNSSPNKEHNEDGIFRPINTIKGFKKYQKVIITLKKFLNKKINIFLF